MDHFDNGPSSNENTRGFDSMHPRETDSDWSSEEGEITEELTDCSSNGSRAVIARNNQARYTGNIADFYNDDDSESECENELGNGENVRFHFSSAGISNKSFFRFTNQAKGNGSKSSSSASNLSGEKDESNERMNHLKRILQSKKIVGLLGSKKPLQN
mmetsp:Transcript_3322/g.5164  ORF Transcript_3322/g.5164 Transcript_3322/m.5164 type:complete len:158 (+) Transcript_3322:77-550(+)|eukprot:CAMPEP_0171459278 /NCGR_PEP_ID=MMETSP0945-20130129/4625_1 /TAXON_ID=109269 /ORGANISM="Vaucheria litorea, Strain CCMP2940" /LENGTH=157 /DNA_ID=CAMNT_0011985263 /DNA_START=57 /DNA_END=530 /DNA_ORIENTATION=+